MTERTFVLAISDDDKSPEKDVNEDQSQPSSVISSSLSSKDNTSPENPADEVVGRYGTDTGNDELQDLDAIASLAMLHMLGNVSDVPQDLDRAVELLQKIVDKGHPRGQFMLGFIYATGLGVKTDSAKAVLYYTFAALGDDPFAQAALGYRYSEGLGVQANCEIALGYYRSVASIVERDATIHGGQVVSRKRIPLVEKDSQQVSETDVLQYYQYNADRGDVQSQVTVGRLYYIGHGVEQNYNRALQYFRLAADAGNGNAIAFMGEMHAYGFGVEGNNATAISYFQKAAELSSPVGQNHLAVMHLHGIEVNKDESKAFQLFSKAARQGLPEAQYNLGTLFYEGIGTQKNMKQALKCFKLAAQQGHVLAISVLANMHATGAGVRRDCEAATGLYKNVVERACWMSDLEIAHTAYKSGRYDEAVIRYLWLAELGVEVAQHNAAHILEKGVTSFFAPSNGDTYRQALHNWRRSAEQGQMPSRVKVGDYFYYGLGVEIDPEMAASQYRLAAEANHPQAVFNLGVMHHYGDGLDRDLHLAKRYYDLALSSSSDSEEYFFTQIWPDVKQSVSTISVKSLISVVHEYRPQLVSFLAILLLVVYLARNRRLHEYEQRRRAEQERIQREEQERARNLLNENEDQENSEAAQDANQEPQTP
eukprot:gene502-3828_t